MPHASTTHAVSLATDQFTPVVANSRVLLLLRTLHGLSEKQERSWSQKFFYLTRLVRFFAIGELWSSTADDHMRDKFVALGRDKCEYIYLLARAGTSFGVSTIYLALAVGQNVLLQRERATESSVIGGKVIATEKESFKAERAKGHWREAGEEVEPWIEMREGNLLETLKVEEGIPREIDLVLLDSEFLFETASSLLAKFLKPIVWTPLALPTLQLLQPRLKRGAIVITDNVSMAKMLYKDFLGYIRNPENGFKTLTVPFSGGLELSVYVPEQ